MIRTKQLVPVLVATLTRRIVLCVLPSAALGVVVACAGGSSSPTTPTTPTTSSSTPAPVTYTGAFTGQMVIPTIVNGTLTCTSNRAISGTLRMVVQENGGVVSGQATAQATQSETSRVGPSQCERNAGGATPTESWSFSPPVSGSAASVTFDQLTTSTSGALGLNRGTQRLRFAGALNGGVITGVLTYEQTLAGVGDQGTTFTENAATTMSVTVR